MKICVVVVKYRDDGSERPLISFTGSIDSGYVMETIVYHRCADHLKHEYGHPVNPEDFLIGTIHFVKKEGVWFYQTTNNKEEEIFQEVVHGQQALEEYGSGKMFESLTSMFDGD